MAKVCRVRMVQVFNAFTKTSVKIQVLYTIKTKA